MHAANTFLRRYAGGRKYKQPFPYWCVRILMGDAGMFYKICSFILSFGVRGNLPSGLQYAGFD